MTRTRKRVRRNNRIFKALIWKVMTSRPPSEVNVFALLNPLTKRTVMEELKRPFDWSFLTHG